MLSALMLFYLSIGAVAVLFSLRFVLVRFL